MKESKAIFINTSSQISVRIISLAFTLVSIKLLTNYLGAFGVGEYNTITTYVNFFLVIADLGLFSVTVREISKKPEEEKGILSNVFIIRLVSALVACIVAIGIVFFSKYRLDHNIIYGVIIACGFLFFNLMASIYDVVLQYRLKMQFSALAEFLSKIISIAALFLIVFLKGDFLWVTATIALSGITIFLFKWLFASKYIKFGPQYNKAIADWILRLAIPLGIVFIVNNLFFKLDTLMLFVIKGATAVGIYSVAYKILEVTIFFGSYFASALKPTLSKNILSDKNAVKSMIEKSFLVMLFIALPVSVLCIAFARDIILFLSNEQFLSGSRALVILAISLPVMYFDVLLSEILIANNESRLLLKIAFAILAFNFIFNLIFIPRYSFMGAAWGTLISEVILFVVNFRLVNKIIKLNINLFEVFKLLLVSISTFFAAKLFLSVGVPFILAAIIGIFVYLILAYMINAAEIRSVKMLLEEN